MSQQASSVQADRSGLAVTAAFLATGTATSLTLFLALLVKDTLGMSVITGWAMSVVVVAIIAGLSTNPARYQARGSTILACCFAVPTMLYAAGQHILAVTLGVCALFAGMFAIPLVEWACGLGDDPEHRGRASLFQFSSGREVSNPIPSSLILGMLIFAWPGDLIKAGIVAAPFFGFLLMLASLGGMFAKVRQSSSGLVAVHPKFMPQWFIACALATILCAGIGVAAPLAMGKIDGVASQRLGGPVYGGPRASDLQRMQSAPTPRRNQQQQPLSRQPQFVEKSPNQELQPRSQPKAIQPPDLKQSLLKLLALAAVAAILLWLLKRYQAKILGFLKRLGMAIIKPFRAALVGLIGAIRRRRHEAALQQALASLDDPYAELPQELGSGDLHLLYDRLIADLALISARPKESESVVAFTRRVGMVHSLDRDALQSLAQLLTEATFSSHRLQSDKILDARERFNRLRSQIHASIPAEELALKQAAYRRALAERALARAA